SFARWDRDSSYWRTSQVSFLPEDSQPASVTLPNSGSLRSGQLYPQPLLVLRTSESGCSSWPTPDASMYAGVNRSPNSDTARPAISLATQQWQTPTTMAAKGVEYQRQSDGSDMQILAGQAQNWATPSARDGDP